MPAKSFFINHARLILLLVLLLVIGALLSWGIAFKAQQDRDSRELSLRVTEAVFRHWQAQPLLEASHPSLRSQMTDAQWENQVISMSVLGPLQEIESITGTSNMPLLPFLAEQLTYRYQIGLQFIYAPAVVDLRLLRANDQ